MNWLGMRGLFRLLVMAELVPAIHVFDRVGSKNVDARHEAGHDESLLDDRQL